MDTASKFKVGDKIICNITETYRNRKGVWYRNGEIYTVRNVMTDERYNVESKAECDMLSSNNVWVLGRDFELYEEAPKQECKDGVPQVSTDVGTVCEAYHAGLEGWFTVQLLYTNHPTNQDAVACMNVSNNMLFWSDTLRPIKTAEEIAAEEKAKEREEAIQQMCGHTRTSSNSLVLEAQREVCEDLYDAGYRWVKV